MMQPVLLCDRDTASLRRQARAVSLVWNYCNRVQRKAVHDRRRWLSAYDLMKLTAGAGELIGLHSHSVSGVCKRYDAIRRDCGAPWLAFRGRRARPWVPFNTGHVSFDGSHIVFRGERFRVLPMPWNQLEAGDVYRSGHFSVDEHGHWWATVRIEKEGAPARAGAPTSTRSALDQGRRRLPPMQHQAPRPVHVVAVA